MKIGIPAWRSLLLVITGLVGAVWLFQDKEVSTSSLDARKHEGVILRGRGSARFHKGQDQDDPSIIDEIATPTPLQQQPSPSRQRRRLLHFGVVHFFNNFLGRGGSGSGDDHRAAESHVEDPSKAGAEVFMITFPDDQETSKSPLNLDTLNITKLTKLNGINGNPRNKYVWSSTLDDNDTLYIGTLNLSPNKANLTNYILSVARAPLFQKVNAMVDALLRQWSGTPIFEAQGGEIYFLNKNATNRESNNSNAIGGHFELLYKASKDFIGFRRMITYQGHVYAGSANGPDGPYDGDPYDFEDLYSNNVGAKIFTNANNNGTFEQLDDQGHLDGYDKSIRSMCVSSFSQRLFIGTETYPCAKILAYYRPSSQQQQQQQQQPYPTWATIDKEECTLSVSQCLDLGGGKILFGTWASMNYGVYLLDETNGDTIAKIETPKYPFHASCGVMELRVFNDHLYVGILSFIRGFALIRTSFSGVDRSDLTSFKRRDWALITRNGWVQEQQEQLGEQRAGNDYTWSSAEVHGTYFIGTFAGSSGGGKAQLWASQDGLDWKIIQSQVFDQVPFMYGFRTMQVTSDKRHLYIGSAANLYTPTG